MFLLKHSVFTLGVTKPRFSKILHCRLKYMVSKISHKIMKCQCYCIVGTKLCDVYHAAMEHVTKNKPELQNRFVKNIGYDLHWLCV
jgi:hypothetical protein